MPSLGWRTRVESSACRQMVGDLFKTLQPPPLDPLQSVSLRPDWEVSRARCRVFASARLGFRGFRERPRTTWKGKRHLSTKRTHPKARPTTASGPEPTSRRLALTLTPPLALARRQHGALLSLQDHRPVRSLPRGRCYRNTPPAAANLYSFAPVHLASIT